MILPGIIILFAILLILVFLSCHESGPTVSRSKHIILAETKESRALVEAIRPMMEATYKEAFQPENIEATIRDVVNREKSSQLEEKIRAKGFMENHGGVKAAVFQKDEDFEAVLIYLHGGAYLFEMTDLHINLCFDLAQKTKTRVVAPLYGRLPEHTCEEAFTMLGQLYQKYLKEGKPLILAGDSSGGGLAMGFYAFCRKENARLPSGLILISPWLDITLSNVEIAQYEEKDMMLASGGLKKLGSLWAGNLEKKDFRVSPINGNLDDLPETLMFSGTEEIMYPDSLKLYEKIGVASPLTFVAGEGLYHIFALSDMTEQGRKAREMMIDMIHRIEKENRSKK